MKKIVLFLFCLSSVFCLYPMDDTKFDIYVKDGVLIRASHTEKHRTGSDVTIVTWFCQKAQWDVFTKRLRRNTSLCPDIPPNEYTVRCLKDAIAIYMADNGFVQDNE